MTRKQIGRNTRKSGRINVSGSERQHSGAEIGDAVAVDVAASGDVAGARIDNTDEESHIRTSA